MADTNSSLLLLPTSIDFLKLPFDIRCAFYEVVDFITDYSGFFNSNNLIAYTTGKSTGHPLLDCSATIRAEAFPYVVKQNPIGLSHTTLLPLRDQRIVGYLQRTDNWNVFHHAIDEMQFDLHKVWDADAAACIAKCANLRCILLMSHIDDVTVTERQLVPDDVLHVLAKNLSLDLLIINIHLSEYEGMRALEEPLSEELNEKWEWLDEEADKVVKALIAMTGGSMKGIVHKKGDGSIRPRRTWIDFDSATGEWIGTRFCYWCYPDNKKHRGRCTEIAQAKKTSLAAAGV